MKAYIKLLIFLLYVIAYFATTFPLYIWAKFNRYGARKYIAFVVQFYAKKILNLLNIRYQLKGQLLDCGRLIVSNHLSYIDVIVYAALNPSCFVTSIEMKETPFLGQLCELGGCLYVERRSRSNLDNEIEDITKALKSGLNVTIFPEATSTNGEEVLRVKRPLFKASINSRAQVTPMTINYLKLNGTDVSLLNRDDICWYGSMTFWDHFWNLLKLDSIELQVKVDNDIKPCEDEVSLSLMAYEVVSNNYNSLLQTD
jgi:1-acyl-sn-glycerol-3-phosphate acyltransferase